MPCVGEPISWLRLERHALAAEGAGDPQVAAHVAACPACRRCLDEIRGDVVALPPLVLEARPPRRAWLRWLVPPLAVAAALALVLVRLGPGDPRPAAVTRVKGVGEVVLGVVRDRGGVVREDVHAFAPGDRWKVVVTCPPDAGAWVDVAVAEVGARTADYPLAPAHVTCGNRVVVPGAFEITGTRANRVCVRVAAGAPPPRALPAPGAPGVACVTLRPR